MKSPLISKLPVDYQIQQKMRENNPYFSTTSDELNPSLLERQLDNKKALESNLIDLKNLELSSISAYTEIATDGGFHSIPVSLTGLERENEMFFEDKLISGNILIPNNDELTISEGIKLVKRKLKIDPRVTLRFWSPDVGVISEGKTIDGYKITANTLVRDITDIPSIEIVFYVKNQYSELQGYATVRNSWAYLFSGDLNFDLMFSSRRDVEIINELYNKLIGPLSTKLLDINEINKLGENFNIQKFSKIFKNSYFNLKFASKDIKDKIATSNDPVENKRRLNEWKKLTDKIYSQTFTPKLAPHMAGITELVIAERAGYAILDYIMREYIKIDIEGTSMYDVASKIKDFLDDEKSIKEIESYFLDDKGRMAYFTSFREAFFDDAKSDKPTITRTIRMLTGRVQEATEFFDSLPDRYLDEFIKADYSFETFLADINYGTGDVLSMNRYLGDADYFYKLEHKILGVDITSVSKAATTDRRFFDNGIGIFKSAYIASPIKSTSKDMGINKNQMNQLVNDLGSSQFSTIFLETSQDSQINEIKPYKATITAPTNNDPAGTLTTILDILCDKQKLNDFRVSERGGTLKMPSKYTYIFAVTALINNKLANEQPESKKEAIQIIKDYLKHSSTLFELQTIASKVYSANNFRKIDDNFYEQTLNLFQNDRVLKNIIKDIPNLGYRLMWEEHINYLFPTDHKLTFEMLPENLFTVIEKDGKLKQTPLTKQLFLEYMKHDSKALLIVHNQEKEIGVVRADLITNLPDEVHEGYYQKGGPIRYRERIFHNVYLCDINGYYLNSKILLESKSLSVRQDPRWYTDFTKIEGKDLTKNYFTAFGIATGNRYLCFLQKTELSFTEGQIYNKYLPTHTTKAVKVVGKFEFQFNPATDKEMLEVYGNEFTKETFYEIFAGLTVPLLSPKQSPQFYAMKFLPQLNGYYTAYDFKNFIYGPDLNDINSRINELFSKDNDGAFDAENFYKLIWKKADGKFAYDQTMKEWLALIYNKITTYGGTDELILFEKENLVKFRDTVKLYSELDTMQDKEQYTVEEAYMANEIFQTAQRIFGHFTVRLMFANMIDFYYYEDGVGIRILDRVSEDKISKQLKHIHFIPLTNYRGGSIASIRDSDFTRAHLFGIFFLGNYIKFPIKDASKADYILTELPFGPLVAINPPGGLEGVNLQSLTFSMATYFESSFNKYHDENLDTNHKENKEILMSEFVKSQNILFEIVKKKIEDKIIIGNYLGDRAANQWFANQLITKLMFDLYYSRLKTTTGTKYIRGYIEEFLAPKSDSISYYSHKIIFHGIVDPKSSKKEEFVLQITQDDFMGVNYKLWGQKMYAKKNRLGLVYGVDAEEFFNYKYKLINRQTDDIIQLLERIIKDLPDKTVRIYPLMNTGNLKLGYQIYKPRNSKTIPDQILPKALQQIQYLPKIPPYFKIDYNNELMARKQLLYIIYLMALDDFIFVMKEGEGGWNDGKISCAFNRYGFLKQEDILSRKSRLELHTTRNYYLKPINFEQFSNEFNYEEFNDMWKKIWDITLLLNVRQFNKYIRDENKDILNNPELSDD